MERPCGNQKVEPWAEPGKFKRLNLGLGKQGKRKINPAQGFGGNLSTR